MMFSEKQKEQFFAKLKKINNRNLYTSISGDFCTIDSDYEDEVIQAITDLVQLDKGHLWVNATELSKALDDTQETCNIEHEINCHADTLPLVARALASSIEKIKELITNAYFAANPEQDELKNAKQEGFDCAIKFLRDRAKALRQAGDFARAENKSNYLTVHDDHAEEAEYAASFLEREKDKL